MTDSPLTDRRAFMGLFASTGLASTLLPGVLWARVAGGGELTVDTIKCAEELAGVSFTDDQRQMMLANVRRQQAASDALHKIAIDNSVAPAIEFDPVPPGVTLKVGAKRPMARSRAAVMAVPGSDEELAFMPVHALSGLVRGRKVTARRLTELYLERLRDYDPRLHAVITMTDDRAMRQARALDEELARGKYRGPLHGIPWGAKDLLAVKGYKTTWGAGPYREQVIDADATVVTRLDDAGAILVAKLTLGELAQGDRWFGERTRNPWWTEQGSSGSSAGPASTTAAGCVGFGVGSETLGSISSPATRNGVTGLRPTYGRVPRTGAMALSWTMDKLGPMCRAVEDCALVLDAIAGPDGRDRSARAGMPPFNWDATLDPKALRVGYFKGAFDQPERDAQNRMAHPTKRFDDAALEVLTGKLGLKLIPVEIPEIPAQAMSLILTAEAGAAFEELTRSGRVSEMVQQGPNDWPNTFRSAQLIPAVDYINANRLRTQVLRQWWDLFQQVDVIVTPTFAGTQLQATNWTGNPALILPNGFTEAPPLQPPGGAPAAATAAAPAAPAATSSATSSATSGAGSGAAAPATADTGRKVQPPAPSPRPQVPVSLTFLGGLYDEARLLAVARAYQQATDFHLKRPPI
ncbi:MAG TPA: amidase [Gemmatimonadaceae bacterium]|nr:amidase [Gemmatimonadaceae bacterium]